MISICLSTSGQLQDNTTQQWCIEEGGTFFPPTFPTIDVSLSQFLLSAASDDHCVDTPSSTKFSGFSEKNNFLIERKGKLSEAAENKFLRSGFSLGKIAFSSFLNLVVYGKWAQNDYIFSPTCLIMDKIGVLSNIIHRTSH